MGDKCNLQCPKFKESAGQQWSHKINMINVSPEKWNDRQDLTWFLARGVLNPHLPTPPHPTTTPVQDGRHFPKDIFQMLFHEWKVLCFDSNLTEVYSYGHILQ